MMHLALPNVFTCPKGTAWPRWALILLVAMLLGLSSTSSADTIYIGSGSGDISYPTAQTTLGLEPGDTLYINSGTYGSLSLSNIAGTEANPITIKCDPNTVFTRTTKKSSSFSNITYVIFEDVVFDTYNGRFSVSGDSHDVTFKNFYMNDWIDYGFHIYDSSKTFDGTKASTFYNFKWDGCTIEDKVLGAGITNAGASISGLTNVCLDFEIVDCTFKNWDYSSTFSSCVSLNNAFNLKVHGCTFENIGMIDYYDSEYAGHTAMVGGSGYFHVYDNVFTQEWGDDLRHYPFKLNALGYNGTDAVTRFYNNIIYEKLKYPAVEQRKITQDLYDSSGYLSHGSTEVYFNTMYRSRQCDYQAPLVCSSGPNVTVKHNLMIEPEVDGTWNGTDPNNYYAFRLTSGAQDNIVVSNNLAYETFAGSGLIDAVDFVPSLSSPVLNAATGTVSYISTDFYGDDRYVGTAADIGAVEQQTAANTAPDVDAGSDATITLPSTASLDATVTDDGLPDPPATFTVLWTKTSGPGTVTFTDDDAIDTTASFSASGTYVLRLTADDDALTDYDEVTITVNAALPVGDEFVYDGFATPGDYTNSTELSSQTGGGTGDWTSDWYDIQDNDAGTTVTSSLSYDTLATSAGSLSTSGGTRLHYMRYFTNDEDLFEPDGEVWFSVLFNRSAGTKNIYFNIAAATSEYVGCGFGIDNSASDVRASINGTKGTTNANTSVSLDETVLVVGRVSIDQGYTSGEHVVDIWVNPDLSTDLSSAALRSGDSYVERAYADFESSDRINIYAHEWNTIVYDEIRIGASYADVTPVANDPPVVDAGSDDTITLPSTASLDATVTDDGEPDPPGAFTVLWTKTSGPGTVTFTDDEAVDTTASFSTSGTYVLRLTADDDELTAYDEVTITVSAPPAFAYDGFETPGDYSSSTELSSQTGGGSGDWTSDWYDIQDNDAGTTVTSSLSYSGLATSDGSLSTSGGTRLHYMRYFTNDEDLFEPDGEVWFSVLFNRSAGTKNIYFNIAAATSEYIGCGFGIDNSGSDVRASINGTKGTTNANTSVSLGETVLVVGRVSIDQGYTSGEHVVDIWVNPDLGTDLSNAALRSGDSYVERAYASFESSDRVNIYAHEWNTIVYDEIRIGASYAEVTP